MVRSRLLAIALHIWFILSLALSLSLNLDATLNNGENEGECSPHSFRYI